MVAGWLPFFSLNTVWSTTLPASKKSVYNAFQIEDKVLRSYTSGDFSCFEGV